MPTNNQKRRTLWISMILILGALCGAGVTIASNTALTSSSSGSIQNWLNTLSRGCSQTEVWQGWSGSILSPSLKCQSKEDVLEAVLSGAGFEIRNKSCASGSGFITGFDSNGAPICRTP